MQFLAPWFNMLRVSLKQLKITHKFTQSNWMTYSGPNLNCVWYSYGVNCLYDPVLAVGGTQPMYFDQLSAIYNHYTVVASRIKVTIIPNRTEAFTGGIVIDDDGTPSVTHLDMITQQPSAVFSTSHRDVSAMRLYKSWNAVSVFGPNPMDNDQLRGNASSNPAEIQSFTVFVRPIDHTTTNQTQYEYMAEIEFDTIWNELRSMSGS